jgi:hypothetical protein
LAQRRKTPKNLHLKKSRISIFKKSCLRSSKFITNAQLMPIQEAGFTKTIPEITTQGAELLKTGLK